MSFMEQAFEATCKMREIPGAVLLAADRSGKFHYAKNFGVRSLQTESEDLLKADDVMWIASCTKLMTCIAAMQCVEQGKLLLDEDVTTILPELKDMDILTGFDENDKPITKKATRTMTLRMLLTHSSGMSYDVFNPILQKWRKSQGQTISPGTTIASRYDCPLLYEPGTAWGYSPSIDWAGKMVERVNDNVSLEDYMKKYIWEPLGIKDMIFHLRNRPDLRKRLTATSMRDPTGCGTAIYIPDPPWVTADVDDAMGGGGAFGSPQDYFKVVQAVLANDGKLLRAESMEEFFKPHLSRESQQAFMKLLEDPDLNRQLGGLPAGAKKDWSLAGLLMLEDMPGWRRKHTLTWGGLPNLTWMVDRTAGLCALYSSQIIPPGDPKSIEMFVLFERAMYERHGGATAHI